jgi:hypothetical protein
MKKKLIIIALLLIPLTGCMKQYRESAIVAHEEAVRIYNEAIDNLYGTAVKSTMALGKARILDNKDSLEELDESGLRKIDIIINEMSQSLVDAAFLIKNAAEANGLSDLAWIYMDSRTTGAEIIGEAVKDGLE